MKVILNDIHERENIIRNVFKLKGSKIGITREFNDVELMDQRKLLFTEAKTQSNGFITYNVKYVHGTFKLFSVNTVVRLNNE